MPQWFGSGNSNLGSNIRTEGRSVICKDTVLYMCAWGILISPSVLMISHDIRVGDICCNYMVYLEFFPRRGSLNSDNTFLSMDSVYVYAWLVSVCGLNKWWYFEQWQANEAVIWPVTRKRIRNDAVRLTIIAFALFCYKMFRKLVLVWYFRWLVVIVLFFFSFQCIDNGVPSEIWRKS